MLKHTINRQFSQRTPPESLSPSPFLFAPPCQQQYIGPGVLGSASQLPPSTQSPGPFSLASSSASSSPTSVFCDPPVALNYPTQRTIVHREPALSDLNNNNTILETTDTLDIVPPVPPIRHRRRARLLRHQALSRPIFSHEEEAHLSLLLSQDYSGQNNCTDTIVNHHSDLTPKTLETLDRHETANRNGEQFEQLHDRHPVKPISPVLQTPPPFVRYFSDTDHNNIGPVVHRSSHSFSSVPASPQKLATIVPKTVIKIFTQTLQQIGHHVEYVTLSIDKHATCMQVIQMLLKKLRLKHCQPELFYLTFDLWISTREGTKKTVITLGTDSRPVSMLSCCPLPALNNEPKFTLQIKPSSNDL